MYTFRAFRAINDRKTCVEFLKGHVKVLVDYGITNITTNNEEWMSNPNVYVITATSNDTNEIVGGIRVHKADRIIPLPVEVAIGSLDARIFELIDIHVDEGTGELCGLWNSKAVAGLGISLLLIRAGISIVNQFNLASLFTICAEYTLPMVKRVGFIVEDDLGENGSFVYPNEKYIARVLKKLDAILIEAASSDDRNRIFDLRDIPIQKTLEIINDKSILIDYDLQIEF